MISKPISGLAFCLTWCFAVTYSTPDGVAGAADRDRGFIVNDADYVKVESDGWELKGRLLKEETVPYEAIWLEIVLKNTGDEAKYSPRLAWWLGFATYKIYTIDNEPIPTMMGYVYELKDSTTMPTIEPNSDDVCYTNILNAIASSGLSCPKLPPGRYFLDVSLYIDPWSIEAREEYTLILPRMEFRVVTPTGDTAEAYELYQHGIGGISTIPDQGTPDMAVFTNILDEYPQTPYAELANRCLYNSSGGIEKIRWRKRYFTEYPHSPLNIHNFNALRRRISAGEMRELYKTVINNPNAGITKNYIKRKYPWVIEGDNK